ncbi:hypothetical protein NIES3787_06100 [Microcystis aeruginosa NIES-3787]|uniref:Uncharacterized protein n=1 Tax=Microcystis aeruginosa NIES-3787 TaxID=2517782 RepID=A0A6H9FP67_MICAE|nr:hypothetical protein NIES3787_06100 [Microcystis aeruginosa NIES-3787]
MVILVQMLELPLTTPRSLLPAPHSSIPFKQDLVLQGNRISNELSLRLTHVYVINFA